MNDVSSATAQAAELGEVLDRMLAGRRDQPEDSLSAAGFARVGLPESLGGDGGSLVDAATVLERVAYHAAPGPVAETAWLGGWLLAETGQHLPPGRLSAACADLRVTDGRVHGVLRRVPYGADAAEIVALGDGFVCRIDPAQCVVERGANLAGEPRDDVTLPGLSVATVATTLRPRDLMLRGALARSVQLSGAARAALERSVRYAQEREQFGRPIGRFQAVQQHLAVLAAEVFVMDVSVRAAVAWVDTHSYPLAVAAAKYNASRGARTVARIAHQVHGAMGTTQEHPLRLSTMRLWSWAAEFGSARYWAQQLGQDCEGHDPWAFLTGTDTAR